MLVKRFPPGDPLVATAFAMPIGATLLVVVSLVMGETRRDPDERRERCFALAYLVIVATSISFSLTLFVLSRWSASVAAYGFLLSPLVTIALGAILLDEHVHAGIPARWGARSDGRLRRRIPQAPPPVHQVPSLFTVIVGTRGLRFEPRPPGAPLCARAGFAHVGAVYAPDASLGRDQFGRTAAIGETSGQAHLHVAATPLVDGRDPCEDPRRCGRALRDGGSGKHVDERCREDRRRYAGNAVSSFPPRNGRGQRGAR